ncbi:hypothetical protein NIES806_42980 [Dolichospermum compactum NIES-806]|uniref:Uncharacterized protein n=1 Tax=Dolichospermum compactum NIES-806 TaxID=1973481 RepID=A0A1Z4V9G6_9CYAN|nr:hypothetical protein NIES806_42980 [Dolichospermum compactum NIES-806]
MLGFLCQPNLRDLGCEENSSKIEEIIFLSLYLLILLVEYFYLIRKYLQIGG